MNVLFTPKAYQAQAQNVTPDQMPIRKKDDKISTTLIKTIRFLVVGLLFLLPIFFVPQLSATLGFDKTILTLAFGLVAIILGSLSVLRFNKVSTVLPLPLLLFALFVVAALLSSLISGDIADSLRGSTFEVQTTGFLAVMLLAIIIPLFLQQSKVMSLTALIAFSAAAGLVVLYNVIRLFVGADSLTLASFKTLTVSPVGGFNDLATLSAVVVMLGLVTLLQLPLKNWMKWLVAGLVLLATALMMVVNFFFLWIIVGFFGLLFLIYLLSRDTLFGRSDSSVKENNSTTPLLLFLTLIICVVSAGFILAGDFLGEKLNEATEVNYVEVRPSMSATLDMIKSVYQEDALLGSGPNRFSDVWRLHKDRSINETAFWNVNFTSGFGFVPTLFVTTGLLGGILIVAFHLSYLYLGYRMLIKADSNDSFWYYVGTASFVGALLLWLITYVYTPGATIMLLAALFTGFTFVAYQALVPSAVVTVPLVSNRRRGFFLMALSVFVVVASVTVLLSVGKQYVAQTTFSRTQANATSIEEFEIGIQSAYELYPNDVFLERLAQVRLLALRQLINIPEPTKADEDTFVATTKQVILLGQESVRLDPTNPDPYVILASVYYVLAQVGLEGAKEQAVSYIEDAKWRDPLNPEYILQLAYISAQEGDFVSARANAQEALKLKLNFSEALFLLSQIDIQEGDVESAIANTQQLITYEPNNPTRFYQLGILLASNRQLDEAIEAYQIALTFDSGFANARYMLALALVDKGQTAEALQQLRLVQESNQDNQDLVDLINRIESGEVITPNLGLEAPVAESDPNTTTDEAVITSADTDTSLVSPVNTPASDTSAQQEDVQSEVGPVESTSDEVQ